MYNIHINKRCNMFGVSDCFLDRKSNDIAINSEDS